ncbi:MAG: hypothetical protein H6711_17875 [Myxococcales bacterium]|nr:hypothetical protein [Myxococcales bacterium]
MRRPAPITATRVSLTLALALTLGACGGSPPEPAPASAPAPATAPAARPADEPASATTDTGRPPAGDAPRIGEVMIRRTMCYGDCPAYTAFFTTDGRVFYHGRANVDHLGVRTGAVSPDDVAALLDLSERSGYWRTDHEYDDRVTDRPTVYTAVVKDGRRHWVRDYTRTPPASLAVVEAAIDALLEYVTWDPTPRLEADDEGACRRLGAQIADRCAAVLTVTGTGGECPHWFSTWDSLTTGHNVDASDLDLRCARALQSLELTEAPPTRPHNQIKWGPHCQKWNRTRVGACHQALLAGDVDLAPCAETMRWTEIQTLGVVRDGYSADTIRISEYFCERWTRD